VDSVNSGQDGVVQEVRRSLVARPAVRVGVLALGVLTAGAGLTIAADGAVASGCAATITISGPSHGHLSLSPSAVKVQTGDCVTFANSADNKVSVTISQSGKTVFGPTTIAKGGTASFTPSSAGKDSVTASMKIIGNLITQTGSGTVTATAPPRPHPSKSSSSKPTPKQTKSGKPPRVASSPKHNGNHKQSNKANGKKGKNGAKTPQPHATGIKLPPLPPLPSVGISALPKGEKPVVAPGVTPPPVVAGQPTSQSASPVAAVLSGPIEPLDSDRRGLPVAIGVLVVLGIATGWGRVLLATSGAGDNRTKASRHL
jgi:plastocyanin